MYVSYTTIICTLLLYPGIHCNEEGDDDGAEDVDATSKRIADRRKKARRSAWDQKFAMASCLTERKSDEASGPLIISGTSIARRSL